MRSEMVRIIKIAIALASLFVSSFVFAQEANNHIKEKYDLAVDYFLQKDYTGAHNTFKEIATEEPVPYSAIVYFNMGMCLQTAGIARRKNINDELSKALFTQAEIYYQKAQDILPYFAQINSNAGLVAYYQDQPNKFVEEMIATGREIADQFGAFLPDVDNALYSYRSQAALLSIAANHVAVGKYREAVSILKDIIVLMEKNVPQQDHFQYTAYNSLGFCLFNLGDTKGAIDSFENSIKIAPLQPKLDVSYANLGMLYFKQGDYPEAHDAVDKALALNPNNRIALDYKERLKGPPVGE